jgi:hypothetical protein
MAAGRRALGEGHFHLAARELNQAVQRRDQQPGLLAPEEDRQLNQLQRQSDLLARLLTHSLQEVVQQGARVRDDDEWEAQFNKDYRGRTVLFDDLVGPDPTGRPALTSYKVAVAGQKVRVALEDLTLLQALPLDVPQRLVFGARLAQCAREAGGVWVIRFEPGSGVLLTDAGAAAACGPPDREVLEVLRRQQAWLEDLPVQQAASQP